MLSLPTARTSWNLDAVSIIAVLGEHNIFLTSQNICLSRLCFLPRLIPAPQGLLSVRPRVLPFDDDISGGVRGLYMENHRAHLSYLGMLLHGSGDSTGEHLPENTVREIRIRETSGRPVVLARRLSPLNMVAVASFLLTMGLVAWAVVLGDGVALIGILVMALTTPVLCLGRKWSLRLPARTIRSVSGDVVWRTPHGSFTLVHCSEDIARALYFAPERPQYLAASYIGQGFSGVVGGLTLVTSIVLFGNATWTMKAALLASYTALNIVYWLVTLCPPRWTWRFNVEVEETLHKNNTYMKAIWTAIRLSKNTKWVIDSNSLPRTKAWERWLSIAEEKAKAEQSWDAQGALLELLATS